ncbi:hypothetical protein [Paenibacillus sp. GYB003]|uniref:hypothetical protein n=1 Tax=Paenibacillus sp. GYB003 TaxID=2994392 RepID=UPI003FA68359
MIEDLRASGVEMDDACVRFGVEAGFRACVSTFDGSADCCLFAEGLPEQLARSSSAATNSIGLIRITSLNGQSGEDSI